jgi:hypothetical protein
MILSLQPSLQAWGNIGHRIVANIADTQLNVKAKTEANFLLDGMTLASVSTWADAVRPYRPYTVRWHFVNIPRYTELYVKARDCAQEAGGDCIIAEIERAIKNLENRGNTKRVRSEALKYLIHFVGDIHQPFHAIDNGDRGGNDVPVIFFGTKTNLHAVWDTYLIAHAGLDPDELPEKLTQPQFHSISPVIWAEDAHDVAQRAYVRPGTYLATRYFNRYIPFVEDQLSLAGARLAAILNGVLGDDLQQGLAH